MQNNFLETKLKGKGEFEVSKEVYSLAICITLSTEATFRPRTVPAYGSV